MRTLIPIACLAVLGACYTPEQTTARRDRTPGETVTPAPGTIGADRKAERRDQAEDLCRLSGGVYDPAARPPREGEPIIRPTAGAPSDYRCERGRG